MSKFNLVQLREKHQCYLLRDSAYSPDALLTLASHTMRPNHLLLKKLNLVTTSHYKEHQQFKILYFA
jgi:hypothetical protein